MNTANNLIHTFVLWQKLAYSYTLVGRCIIMLYYFSVLKLYSKNYLSIVFTCNGSTLRCKFFMNSVIDVIKINEHCFDFEPLKTRKFLVLIKLLLSIKHYDT